VPRRGAIDRRQVHDRGSEEGETIFGLRAGLAVLAKRRDDILRLAFGKIVRHEIAELVRWATTARVPFFEASDDDLARIARSKQHEGLCLLVRARKWTPPSELVETIVTARGALVALDRVRNPYNVGAILRSAAFFGMEAALLGAPAPHPGLPEDAVRVAEGGVEHLTMSRTTDLADTLARMRSRGATIVAADAHGATNAIGFDFRRPVVLVVGNEREGISDRVRAQCDALVKIEGSGAVESLNVAVAAGVLIAEMARPRR
jgi:TrmH RNA methyltransferase